MKQIIIILIFSIYLNATSLETQTTISSNYIFRGLTQNNNTPNVSAKIAGKAYGFHFGAWSSRVRFDMNNTFYNKKITKANAQVDLFGEYAFKLGRTNINIGYIDRRYVIQNHLESNISAEYYGVVNFNLGMDTTIKTFYDKDNKNDPTTIEITLKEEKNFLGAYITYGRHMNSKNAYWKLRFNMPLKYFKAKGFISVDYNRFIPKMGKNVNNVVVSYTF